MGTRRTHPQTPALHALASVATVLLILTQCSPPRGIERKLLTAEFASSWKTAGIAEAGKVTIKDGEITLHPGQPMTGVRFEAWQTAELPLSRYSIEYEAMRVEGNDFFGTVTFPVNDALVSLVIGGWGGTLVGISSIDDLDASENTTTGNAFFKNYEWHKVRIEVRDDDLRAWINGKLFVNVSTKGHQLGLRAGDIEKCAPFGFASYATHARIRDVIIRRL
ncbi:MAG: family 16 glycoside hydrolase [Prosthecobacter sp.]|uniref:family 16 glycoside hydrolase n=1 Tax=Prosthecobacter sp. TaxID=1965333 RepID=UPI0039007244